MGDATTTPRDSAILPVPIPKPGLVEAGIAYAMPSLIAAAGDQASWRYIDFFTANIRNPNTRRAYIRACETFLAWCEQRGRTLATIRPFDVSTHIEGLTRTHSAPTVKQQLAAIRMLFDSLITGQVVLSNPASAVRGPKEALKNYRSGW